MKLRGAFRAILLSACLATTGLPTPVAAQPPQASAPTVDGVAIGMTYSEVLAGQGRPRSLREREGKVCFVYPSGKDKPDPRTVWFGSGKVVYASGYTLEQGGETLFLFGMVGAILEDQFGPSETLNAFARWWPRAGGVVLAGTNNIWPNDLLKSPLGLRDPDYPISWEEDANGKRWSKFEPWLDDESTEWLADDVSLGMAEERARRLAGSLDIVYEGGYVRAIRRPRSVLLQHLIGYQDYSTQFDVGQDPQRFGGVDPSFKVPQNGWFVPAASGRVRMKKGKIAEVQLRLVDDAPFEALKALEP